MSITVSLLGFTTSQNNNTFTPVVACCCMMCCTGTSRWSCLWHWIAFCRKRESTWSGLIRPTVSGRTWATNWTASSGSTGPCVKLVGRHRGPCTWTAISSCTGTGQLEEPMPPQRITTVPSSRTGQQWTPTSARWTAWRRWQIGFTCLQQNEIQFLVTVSQSLCVCVERTIPHDPSLQNNFFLVA